MLIVLKNLKVFVLIVALGLIGVIVIAQKAPHQVNAEGGESITSGQTGWWKFNDGSGSTATDSSSSAHNGILNNMIAGDWSTDVPSDFSANNTNSLNFNGSNKYVSIANPGLPTGNFTFTAWVKPAAWPVGKMSILSAGSSTTAFTNISELDWYFTSAGNMALTLHGIPIATTAFAFPLNQWSHVAVTRSGSIITFYINGVLSGGGASSSTLGFSTCPLAIGTGVTPTAAACTSGFTAYWNGKIDDVRVYNQALSLSEIRQMAGTPTPGGISVPLGLWLKAGVGTFTDNGCTVPALPTQQLGCWADLSGNGLSLNATPNGKPTLQLSPSFVGLPVVNFNGSASLNRTGVPETSLWGNADGQISQLIVWRTTSGGVAFSFGNPGQNGRMANTSNSYIQNNGGDATISKTSAIGSVPALDGSIFNTPNLNLFKNISGNGSSGSFPNGVSTSLDLAVGATPNLSNPITGEIAEVAVFQGGISAPELQRIMSYLAIKYGVSIDQSVATDYLASNGTTKMWDSTLGVGFNFRIAGIGQDNLSGYLGLSGASSDPQNIFTMSNASALSNLRFLTFGDNNGSATFNTSGAPSGFQILNRKWQAQLNNGSIGSATVAFNVNNSNFLIPSVTGSYYLSYDANNNGNLGDDTPAQLYDDGTHGDTTASDNTWSASGVTIPNGAKYTMAAQSGGLGGTVYLDKFSTPLGAGKTLHLYINGTDSGLTANTNASGQFSFANANVAAGDVLTLYLDGQSEKALLITTATGGLSQNGLNLSVGRIILRSDNGGSLTPAQINLGHPGAGVADIQTLLPKAGLSNTSFNVQAGSTALELVVPIGHSLDLSGISGTIGVATSFDVGGSLNVGSHDLSVAGAFTVGGSYLASGNTFTLGGSVAANFGYSGTFPSNLVVATTGGAAVSLTGALNLGGNSLNITSGALNLNGNNLTMTGGGFSLANGAMLQLQGTETVSFSGGTTQDIDSGTWQFIGTGSGTLTLPNFGATGFNNLSINAPGTTFQLGGNVSLAGGLTIPAGSLNLNGHSLIAAGNLGLSTGASLTLGTAANLHLGGSLTATGGTLTLNGAGVDITGGFSLSGAATATLGATTGFTVANGLSLDGTANLNIGGTTATIGGGVTLATSASLSTGANGTLNLGGTLGLSNGASLSVGANGALGVGTDLALTGTSGLTLAAGASLSVTGNASFGSSTTWGLSAAGTIGITGSLSFGGGTTNLNAVSLSVGTNLSLGGNAAVSLGSGINFAVTGNTSLSSTASLNMSGQTATLHGNLDLVTGTSLVMGASAHLTVGGAVTAAGGGLTLNGTSAAISGGLNLSASATASLGVGTSFTVGNGLALSGTATLNINGQTAAITGNTTLNAGASLLTGANGNLNLSGSLNIGGAASAQVGANATLGVHTDLHLTGSGAVQLAASSHLTVDANTTLLTGTQITASGSATLGLTGSLAAAGGTITVPAGSLSVGTTFALTSGASVTFGATADLTIGGNTSVDSGSALTLGTNSVASIVGNFANNGTFVPSTSSVNLTGVNQTLTGNTTFHNLAKTDTTNNSTNAGLTFASGSTTTVNGALTLDGLDQDDRLVVSSSTPGTPAAINFSGVGATNIVGNNLTVNDSTLANVAGAAVSFPINPALSVNGGNTTNWFSGPTDIDGDGTLDAIELAGPNGGDANGDGVLDYLQANVATSLNPVTLADTTIEITGGTLTSSSIERESDLPAPSATVEFPVGLNTFTVAVPTVGASVTARIIYDKVYNTAGWMFYSAFPGGGFAPYSGTANFQTSSIGGHSVTVSTFGLTDGGAGDYDNIADQVIHDPHGPAVLAAATGSGTGATGGSGTTSASRVAGSLLNTGQDLWAVLISSIVLVLVCGTTLVVRVKKPTPNNSDTNDQSES